MLQTNGSISGTIFESDGTTTITSDVIIEVLNADTNAWAGVTTEVNGDGTYSLGLPPGDYHVTAAGSSWAREFYSEIGPDVNSAGIVTVLDGTDTPNIDFTLDPGGTISGTVFE